MLRKASRKAVAIALNYADHAAEMRSSTARDAPFWFFKPSTSYLPPNSGPILLPDSAVVHHEVELAVVIGKPARDVSATHAAEHIAGYLCAIDLTARNWQTESKEKGRPWSLAKGCDTFLPFSDMLAPEAVPLHPETGVADVELYLDINGEQRQSGSTRQMIWTIPELIEHISRHVTLEEWDMILTGTPAGVGVVKPGDRVTAGIRGLVEMQFDAVQRPRAGAEAKKSESMG